MGVAHGRYLTGNKEGSNGLMVLRVMATPTRFQTNSLYTPMDSTPLHSIPSLYRPYSTSIHGTASLVRDTGSTRQG